MSYRLNTLITSDIDVPSYEKRISICLLPNGFSFSIVSTKDVLLTVGVTEHQGATDMASLAADIKELFQTLNINPFGYDMVELVAPSSMATWIPDDLYEEDHKMDYLHVFGTVPASDAVFVDHSNVINAYNVFAADGTLVMAFKIAIPGIIVRSQQLKMVTADTMKMSAHGPVVLMYVRQGFVDFAAFNAQQLLLTNTFEATSNSDLLCHALNIMHQLQIELPSTQLLMCGDVDRDTYAALRDYFPIVKLYNGRPLRFGNPEFQHLHTYSHALILS